MQGSYGRERGIGVDLRLLAYVLLTCKLDIRDSRRVSFAGSDYFVPLHPGTR
jgi:hypothetical protein